MTPNWDEPPHEVKQEIGRLRAALLDGKEHAVSEAAFRRHASCWTRVVENVSYQGHNWQDGFADGREPITLFREDGGKYFARRMPWLNPRTAGSIEKQKSQLKMEWAKFANRNEEFRGRAPGFSSASIEECATDADVVKRFTAPSPAGTAFHVGDICFIKTSDESSMPGRSRWMTLKDRYITREDVTIGNPLQKGEAAVLQGVLENMRAIDAESLHRARHMQERDL